MSVSLPIRIEHQLQAGWFFMKFDVQVFFENLLGRFSFY